MEAVAARSASLIALAADLERRDALVAAESAHLAGLAARVDAVSRRAAELDGLLGRIPGERASLDRLEAELRSRHARAVAELDSVAEQVAELERERARQAGGADRERAAFELRRARAAAADVAAQIDRLRQSHMDLGDAETGARVEARALAAEAVAVADSLAASTRISESGRVRPQATLVGLVSWAARAHAALVVARAQLDIDRDRLVREANELGSVLLGEELAGSSVALVGRRVRTMLAG